MKPHCIQTLRLAYRAAIGALPKNRIGDRLYSLVDFVLHHHRLPTHAPIFNDVLYFLKTTDEILDPLRVFVSDKEYLKLYVKAVIGEQHNVPTLAVLGSASEIDAFQFPAACCIKATHGSGRTIIRSGCEPLDVAEIKTWLAQNHYLVTREANYRQLTPKVIVEPLVFGSSNAVDYKFFCLRGQPRLIQVDVDRFTNHKRTLLTVDWVEQEYSVGYPKAPHAPPRPANLDEMLDVAGRLSALFSFVRVDLYSDGNNCFVGEITNCHGNAQERFIPRSGEAKASAIIFGDADWRID